MEEEEEEEEKEEEKDDRMLMGDFSVSMWLWRTMMCKKQGRVASVEVKITRTAGGCSVATLRTVIDKI